MCTSHCKTQGCDLCDKWVSALQITQHSSSRINRKLALHFMACRELAGQKPSVGSVLTVDFQNVLQLCPTLRKLSRHLKPPSKQLNMLWERLYWRKGVESEGGYLEDNKKKSSVRSLRILQAAMANCQSCHQRSDSLHSMDSVVKLEETVRASIHVCIDALHQRTAGHFPSFMGICVAAEKRRIWRRRLQYSLPGTASLPCQRVWGRVAWKRHCMGKPSSVSGLLCQAIARLKEHHSRKTRHLPKVGLSKLCSETLAWVWNRVCDTK